MSALGEEGNVPPGRLKSNYFTHSQNREQLCLTSLFQPEEPGSVCSFSHSLHGKKHTERINMNFLMTHVDHGLTFLKGHRAASTQRWSFVLQYSVYCTYCIITGGCTEKRAHTGPDQDKQRKTHM